MYGMNKMITNFFNPITQVNANGFTRNQLERFNQGI